MSSILGIEVGSKKVFFAVLTQKGRKFLLSKKGAVPIQGTAPDSVSSAVLSVIEGEKVPAENVYITFLRDDIVSGQLIVPRIPPNELEEVVSGEIEKIPAFSNSPFHFIFSGKPFENTKTKVLFSAVSSGLVDTLISEGRKKKLNLRNIEIAPCNLLGMMYSLNKEAEEAVVLIDDAVTYVAVIGKKECKLLYTSSIGRSALYKEGKLESGEFLSWTEELRRTFKSYALSYKVKEIKDCWLIWDKDKAGLEEQIEQKLGVRVKSPELSMFADFGTASGINATPRDCVAAAGAINRVNNFVSEFRFAELIREQFLKGAKYRIELGFVIYAIFIIVVLGGVFAFYGQQRARIGNKLVQTRQSIEELERKTQALRDKRDEAARARQLLFLQTGFVKELNRVSWSRVFGEVAAELPPRINFSSFRVSGTSSVEIKGLAVTIQDIAGLVRRIDSSAVLQNAKFDYLREEKEKESALFSFGILAGVRKD